MAVGPALSPEQMANKWFLYTAVGAVAFFAAVAIFVW